MRLKFFTTVSVFTLGAASLFAQARQTITGTVTDAMCGAHHMMKDATPAQCTGECVKQGSDYAPASGGKVYTLKGDKAESTEIVVPDTLPFTVAFCPANLSNCDRHREIAVADNLQRST
jgi:hypothetical protein